MDYPVRKSSEVHGPRPPPLKVRKVSHAIDKKPPANAPRPRRRPVVIYIASPKVVHATPAEFRSVVQRLTGFSASAISSSNSYSVSRSAGGQAFGSADCLATLGKAAAATNPSTSEEVLTQIAGGGSVALLPPVTSPAVLHQNSSFFFESESNNFFSSEVVPSPVASYREHLHLNKYQA